MVKAKKLPSGNWRARVQTEVVNGKQMYESFVAETENEANFLALEFELKYKDKAKPMNLTVGGAIDKYINIKSNVLSPTTIREYKRCRKNDFPDLINTKLKDLKQEHIQIAINELSADHSPKFVRNAHGLLSTVLKMYHPHFMLNTTLPQKKDSEILIPSKDEVDKILEYVKGKDEEVPFVLGACCGLRRSEIVGLKWNCIDFKKSTARIKEARVRGEENKVVTKGTKSRAGTRTIRIFPFVIDILKKARNDSEYVSLLSGDTIYNRFNRILITLNIQHYRFHDLRHFIASAMLSMNIPKKYIADYLGHETENMIDRVYGHIMEEKKTAVEDQLEDYFTKPNATINVTDIEI